jgi:hypothetical protein
MSAVATQAAPGRAAAVSRLYFAGGGAEAAALLEQCRSLHLQHLDRLSDLQHRLGADCLSKFGDGTLHAICYLHGLDEPSRPLAGLRCVMTEPTSDGQVLHFFQPDKRTPEGLAIARQAREIGPFNPSDWLLERIGGHRCRIAPEPGTPSGLNLHYALAFGSHGPAGEVLVATLPATPDQPFTPPSWLKPIYRPEFDALVRASQQRRPTPSIH